MKKILIPATVVATILTTSIGVYAASNTNSNATVKTQAVSTTVNPQNQLSIANDISNSKGYIEYTKTTTIRPDGSQGMTFEQWDNPKTFDSRSDNILKIDGKISFTSTYSKDNGKNIVILHRDANGKVTDGENEAVNQSGADYNNSLLSKRSFAAVKDQYESSNWIADGTEKTQDGKTLKKVSRTYNLAVKKASAKSAMKEVAYLDTATGLPAKIEIYGESNGKMSLIETKVYEFKYIATAENIFDTSGINLKQLPQFNYDVNAKG